MIGQVEGIFDSLQKLLDNSENPEGQEYAAVA